MVIGGMFCSDARRMAYQFYRMSDSNYVVEDVGAVMRSIQILNSDPNFRHKFFSDYVRELL